MNHAGHVAQGIVFRPDCPVCQAEQEAAEEARYGLPPERPKRQATGNRWGKKRRARRTPEWRRRKGAEE